MAQTRRNGFTMIELLVVIAVMGLVLALASPRVHRLLPGVALRTGAADLAAALRSTRASAMRRGERADLVLDLANGLYRWPTGKGEAHFPPGIEIDALTDRSAIDESARRAAFAFFPDGTAAGGVILLRRSGSGEGERVAIDWLTGRVAVEPIE